MLNWMARTALELIGQGGLGYSFDPLLKDAHNEFGDALKRLLYVLVLMSGLLPVSLSYPLKPVDVRPAICPDVCAPLHQLGPNTASSLDPRSHPQHTGTGAEGHRGHDGPSVARNI